MCVWSKGRDIRKAEQGDKAIVHDFRGYAGKWFAEPKEVNARGKTRTCMSAVCVVDGSTLQLSGIPEELQKEYGFRPIERVHFIEGDDRDPQGETRKDRFFFRTADMLSIRDLPVGLKMEVLSLEPIALLDDTPLQKVAKQTLHTVDEASTYVREHAGAAGAFLVGAVIATIVLFP